MSTATHTHDVKEEVKRYLIVFYALLGLTLVTVSVSYLHLKLPQAIALALAIAIIKGSLVACYFMHLISERRLIYLILSFVVIFFFGLLLIPLKESYNVPQGTQHLKGEPVKAESAHH